MVSLQKAMKLGNAIAKGDYANRLNMNRRDEIGVLADSLDSMSVA